MYFFNLLELMLNEQSSHLKEKLFDLQKVFLKWAVFLTIVFSPLYVIRWNYGPLPTTLLEHLIGISLAVWIIFHWALEDRSLPRTSLDGWVMVIFLALGISLMATPDLRGGLGIFKAYFLEPILFFYILIDCLRKKVTTPKQIFLALTISGAGVAALGIFQTLTGQFVFAPHEMGLGRAHAVYNSANALALYIGPLLGLLIGVKLCSNEKNDRLLRGGLFLLMALGLFLTQSDGAILGALVIIVFYAAVRFVKCIWLTHLLAAAGIIYIAAHLSMFFWVPQVAPSVDNPWQRVGGTEITRLCLWEGTVDLLGHRPLTGAGLSGFKEIYGKQFYTCDAEPLEYPHNLFLSFWSELGVLGLISFLGLWGLTLYGGLNKDKEKTNWGIMAGLVYWLIHGLVDVPYFKNDLSLIFWVFLALAWWKKIPSHA